jgi:hypothetical protein
MTYPLRPANNDMAKRFSKTHADIPEKVVPLQRFLPMA